MRRSQIPLFPSSFGTNTRLRRLLCKHKWCHFPLLRHMGSVRRPRMAKDGKGWAARPDPKRFGNRWKSERHSSAGRVLEPATQKRGSVARAAMPCHRSWCRRAKTLATAHLRVTLLIGCCCLVSEAEAMLQQAGPSTIKLSSFRGFKQARSVPNGISGVHLFLPNESFVCFVVNLSPAHRRESLGGQRPPSFNPAIAVFKHAT